jgi:predicted dehydrogenase
MIHDRGVDRLEVDAVARDERRQALISYRIGDIRVPALPEREALQSAMTEFAGSIAERRQPLTDGMAGLRVIQLLEAATQSVECDGTRIPVRTGAGR